jgi:hypothetical protein
MSNIYIPPNCTTLDKSTTKSQIRLGIQGYPGSGKTFAALTFPNPIVLNLDRGLGSHTGRADVIEIPLYSGDKTTIKDRIIQWLDSEAGKLTSEQTLVIDSCTAIETSYHIWFKKNELNLALGRGGRINEFIEWQLKETYFNEIFSTLKTLKCDVVLLTHESEKRDKPTTAGQPGEYTGKIRPVMTGKVADIMNKDFTDWYRQMSAQKPTDYTTIKPESLVIWGMKSVQEFKEMCDTFIGGTIYYWQTQGDNIFDAKASSMVNPPRYVPANFSSITKYQRKNKI